MFCMSKWWGNPDMPDDMEYPMAKYTDGNGAESEYPLTFVCQIDCGDIAELDREGVLPHAGMLYFFAALDDFTGYESPLDCGLGLWRKGLVCVKYTGHINLETFSSFIMLDDEDAQIAERPLAIDFSECGDGDDGIKLLGSPFFDEVREAMPGHVSLLQLDGDETAGMMFHDTGMLNLIISKSDLKFGNFKKTRGYLTSL